MRALTVWQPWASLIAVGAKPYEFRGWPAPKWIIGQRIAIHAGARKPKRGEIEQLRLICRGGKGALGRPLRLQSPAGPRAPRDALVRRHRLHGDHRRADPRQHRPAGARHRAERQRSPRALQLGLAADRCAAARAAGAGARRTGILELERREGGWQIASAPCLNRSGGTISPW